DEYFESRRADDQLRRIADSCRIQEAEEPLDHSKRVARERRPQLFAEETHRPNDGADGDSRNDAALPLRERKAPRPRPKEGQPPRDERCTARKHPSHRPETGMDERGK